MYIHTQCLFLQYSLNIKPVICNPISSNISVLGSGSNSSPFGSGSKSFANSGFGSTSVFGSTSTSGFGSTTSGFGSYSNVNSVPVSSSGFVTPTSFGTVSTSSACDFRTGAISESSALDKTKSASITQSVFDNGSKGTFGGGDFSDNNTVKKQSSSFETVSTSSTTKADSFTQSGFGSKGAFGGGDFLDNTEVIPQFKSSQLEKKRNESGEEEDNGSKVNGGIRLLNFT